MPLGLIFEQKLKENDRIYIFLKNFCKKVKFCLEYIIKPLIFAKTIN